MLRLEPRMPACFQRGRDGLINALENRRDAGRQIVVEQHHAGPEITHADFVAVTLNGLKHQFASRNIQLDRGRFLDLRDQGADAQVITGGLDHVCQISHVLQIEAVACVILRNQQDTGTGLVRALDGGLDRLRADRLELRVQIVEAARKQVGVHRGQFEAGIAQISGAVKGWRRLHPLLTKPGFNICAACDQLLFKTKQRRGLCGCRGLGCVGHDDEGAIWSSVVPVVT